MHFVKTSETTFTFLSPCNSEFCDPKKLSSIQITTRFIQEMQLKTVMSSSSSLDSQASLLKNQAKSPLFLCLSFNQHTFLLSSCAIIQGQPQRHTQGDIPWSHQLPSDNLITRFLQCEKYCCHPPFTISASLTVSLFLCNRWISFYTSAWYWVKSFVWASQAWVCILAWRLTSWAYEGSQVSGPTSINTLSHS